MTLWGIRLRVHALTPLVLLVIAALSGGKALIPSFIALGVHEGAHLAYAIRMRARIDEIELMPFGAAIRLYELWSESSSRLIAISLAGPAANLLLCALLTFLLHFFPRLAPEFIPVFYMSLAVCAVNLIPALPLDGGRAFCALLSRRISRSKSVKIGILLGRLLSAGLVLFAMYLFWKRKKLQLTLIFSAVYIFASGEKELRQSEGALLRSLLLSPAPAPSPIPARWIQVSEGDRLYDAARAMETGVRHLFAVTDEAGRFRRVVTQDELAQALKKDSTVTFSACAGQ